ncbi:odorant receptor 46a [Diachasma alloeum]|uniref:Odorant receptor n=1 Tax=Diachasma alloeum TaxID=454923 RepID=A0A4E0RQM2_9HYME|nr:odorant receptor 46a [Diachasma alloeum]THK33094.1 odorant receptor 32 [Diachasma alloeum]
MLEKWNKDAEYDLGFYRLINRGLGIYPFECQEVFSIIRMIIVLTINWIMLYEQVIDLISGCGQTEEIIESIVGALSYPVAIAKIILPRVYWRNMKIILESAVEDWSRQNDAEAKRTMMEWVAIGRFTFLLEITSLCMLLTYTTISHFPFFLLTQNHRENSSAMIDGSLPWGSGCWLPSNTSNQMFLIAYFATCIQQIVGSLSNMGFDVSLFIILSHMCGQIEILKLDSGRNWNGTSFDSSKNPQEVYRQFIDRHNHLLNLCDLFERSFNVIILIHMVLYLGLVTILLLNTFVAWYYQNIAMVIKAVFELMIIYVQLFVYCYAGEKLTNQLENLRDEVYSSPWYTLPKKSMQDVCFILRRLNDPFYLTCGKFYRMNMDYFKNIVKLTASYCSVIRLMFYD